MLLLAGMARAELKLRGEYVLASPDFRLDTWKALLDRFAADGKNFIYWWGSSFFHSRHYPQALFYRDRKGDYLSHAEIRELIRYSQSKGIKFYMAVGGFAWLTVDTLAELYPETRAKGSAGMCPNNPKAHEVNIAWIEELYQTFPELDGIMVELRDEYGACQCEICQTRIDRFGSQKYGQGELKFLRDLSARIWKLKKSAEIVVCIGYTEHRSHNNDVAFYEGIKELGRDGRWIWLEVRDKWRLPAAGGALQPLRYFSPRVVSWYQPEYHSAEELAAWVRTAAAEGLEGVCLGREVGSWGLLFGIREWNVYLTDSFRKHLSLFTFSRMAQAPATTIADWRKMIAREFFGAAAGEREFRAVQYLDELLLRTAKGVGPAGNFYSARPTSARELLRRAADPAPATALKATEWIEAFQLSRAIRKARELEGEQVRDIAGWVEKSQLDKHENLRLIAQELTNLKQLLALEESDFTAIAAAYRRSAAQVPAPRRRVTATSEHSQANGAVNLFDGDLKTNWICRNAVPLPQSVTLELPAPATIDRVSLSQSSQRLDYSTRRYRIEGSVDGYHFESWAEGELPAQLGASRSEQTSGRRARFLRIVVLSIHPAAPYSSPALSEVEIVADGMPARRLIE